jgi:hypothetical protein
MLKQILLTGSSAAPLVDAIAQISHQDIIVIFSGVLRLWLEYIQIQVQTQLAFCSGSHIGFLSNTGMDQRTSLDIPLPAADDTLYDREKHLLFQKASNVDTALYNIIKFSAMTAHRHRTIRFCILDAGDLSW